MIASPLSDEHADSFLRTWSRAKLQRLFMKPAQLEVYPHPQGSPQNIPFFSQDHCANDLLEAVELLRAALPVALVQNNAQPFPSRRVMVRES